MGTTVRDVMTTRVVAVRKDADFKQIAWALRQFRVSACPVIDEAGQVIGVVSEGDLLYKEAGSDLPAGPASLRWKLGEDSRLNATTATQLMSAPAVTVPPGASVQAAARVMRDRRLKRLPVVGADGGLVGIVSRADLLSVYDRPDADILGEVLAVITSELRLNPADFAVTVSSGVVTLAGAVALEETALELLARIRHIEGVVAVRNRLAVGQPAD